MTKCSGDKNRHKLNLVLTRACQCLRELFQKTWQEKFGKDWPKGSSRVSLARDLQNVSPTHRKSVEEGNINQWDLTVLRAVLTAKGLFALTGEVKSNIKELEILQSKVTNHPSNSIPDKFFSIWYGKLQRILIAFGVSKESLEQNKCCNPKQSEDKPASSNGSEDVPNSPTLSIKLNNPSRIAHITGLREYISSTRRMLMQDSTSYVTRLTVPVPLVQQMPASFEGFKSITLREMYPHFDRIYKQRSFAVIMLDEVAFTGSSIATVIEDENGDTERCAIYNSPCMGDEAQARQMFFPGCKLMIMQPYRRMALDGNSVVRVDDPAALVMQGCVPSMCRYCGKADADKKCSRCKIAKYCDKTCQTLDWKVMKHKLICHQM